MTFDDVPALDEALLAATHTREGRRVKGVRIGERNADGTPRGLRGLVWWEAQHDWFEDSWWPDGRLLRNAEHPGDLVK